MLSTLSLINLADLIRKMLVRRKNGILDLNFAVNWCTEKYLALEIDSSNREFTDPSNFLPYPSISIVKNFEHALRKYGDGKFIVASGID